MNMGLGHTMILIMLLTIHLQLTTAQDDPQPPDDHHPRREIANPIRPSVPVIIGILAVMFSLTLLLCAYAKFCHNPVTSRQQHEFQGFIAPTRPRFSGGIDKAAIASLPFFRFSSLKGSKEGLECAVCISKFEGSEVLRLLPKCKHAFHVTCIDRWLEGNATCPICRYKIDPRRDLRSLSYTGSSLRYDVGSESDLSDRLEIFVERQSEDPPARPSTFLINSTSFRKFNFGSFRKLEKKKGEVSAGHRDGLHKFKHKIVVSDVVIKSRWSDVNSSDLLLLSSEMISASSSERFSVLEQTDKVKEDMERKRLIESRFGGIVDGNDHVTRNLTANSNDVERRSMSEITNVSRFSVNGSIGNSVSRGESDDEETMRRLIWLPIARRTVRWFAGRERTSSSEAGPSNV